MKIQRRIAYLLLSFVILVNIVLSLGATASNSVPLPRPSEAPSGPILSISVTAPFVPKDEVVEKMAPDDSEALPQKTPIKTVIPTVPKPVYTYEEILVPEKYNARDFKSYEDWRAIKSKTSPHYKLQREYAYTGEDGFRMVEDRYCVALGSYFTTRIGQYVDIVLQNGFVIKAILGDQKADKHTDSKHIAHKTDGSIAEFIVDKHEISPYTKDLGSVSRSHENWNSPVVKIIVYDRNFFDEV